MLFLPSLSYAVAPFVDAADKAKRPFAVVENVQAGTALVIVLRSCCLFADDCATTFCVGMLSRFSCRMG